MVILQTGVVGGWAGGVGSATGAGVALGVLAVMRDPAPGYGFTTAVVVLSIAVSLAGAVLPAAIAGTRDPIRELRVP